MSQGRLFINGVKINLGDRIPFPLDFSIADIKEPQKRKRNVSKTIKLPGTQNNLNFFSSTFNLSLTTLDNTTLAGFDFDPTVRTEAKYYKKGILVFDGLVQVNFVEILDGDITFDATLYSNFVDLYMQLKDILVSELGWSEYDHTLTRTIVKNSWDTSVLVDAVPTSNFTGSNPDGFGYLYPLVNYGYPLQTPSTYKTADLVPHIYVKEIIEKCLAIAGITYSSAFLDSARVKQMLFGFGGGDKPSLSVADIAQRQCHFHGDYVSTQTNSYIDNQFVFRIPPLTDYYVLTFNGFNTQNLIQNTSFTETIDSDTLTQYDATTGLITIALSGRYKVDLSGVLNLTLNAGAMTILNQPQSVGVVVKKNGQPLPGYLRTDSSLDGSITLDGSVEMDLISGDTLSLELFTSGNLTTKVDALEDAETIQLDIADTTDIDFNITSIETSITDGANINISRFIPTMKASAFLSGIIKAANLMLSDPDIYNVVTIEPLEDYYQATTEFDDITKRVDHDKPIIIKPASTIDGRFYKFEWADDTDYDNQRYKDEYGIGYGNKIYEVESTFQEGERIYKLPFAQSVPVDIINTTLVIPRIIKFDDNSGITKPHKGKPRIYMYNGLKAGVWRLTNTDDITSFDALTTYPCVHHLDDKDAPTFDLNWGIPIIVYYATSVYTTANMFSVYHERFIKEITGRESKIVELFLKTNADQINKLDFSLLKMWNGVLYRLNTVNDFDDDVSNSTKHEIVKILKANSPRNFGLTSWGYGPIRDNPVINGGGNSTDPDVPPLVGGIGVAQNSHIIKNR